MKTYRFTVGAVLIAASLVYLLVTSVEQSAAKHVTLSSLLQDQSDVTGYRLQLGGCTVVEGSIEWDQYRHRPEFVITDGDRRLRVRYLGNSVLPDTFKDQAQVVLEGHYDASQELFDAQVVFAKCPSKYEGQDYQGHIDAMEASS